MKLAVARLILPHGSGANACCVLDRGRFGRRVASVGPAAVDPVCAAGPPKRDHEW